MDKDEQHGSNLCMTYTTSTTSTCTSPPSTPSAAANEEAAAAAEVGSLYRARLIVENQLYDQLLERYNVAVTRVRELTSEANTLHEENEWLRLANEDLTRRLGGSVSLLDDNGDPNSNGRVGRGSPRSVMVHVDGGGGGGEDYYHRVALLPKCISVPSPTYFKLASTPFSSNNTAELLPSNRPSTVVSSRHVNAAKLRVRREEKAVEMDVYNQGMYKTELCNKWEETGACPYNDNCQFAHGLSELRPVIRHPRYKTQVCRMVLAGATCPYGHRCHFRHSTTTRLNSR